jgi:uncharacterized membrane protein
MEENSLMGIFAWSVGILVSLAVGAGMIDGTLVIPGLNQVTVVAGWAVVIGAIISVILAIFNK